MRLLVAALLLTLGTTLGAAETEPEPASGKPTEVKETRAADRRFRKPRAYMQQARQRLADRREALRAELRAVRQRRNEPATATEAPTNQANSAGSNRN